jgi:hypothetical protein
MHRQLYKMAIDHNWIGLTLMERNDSPAELGFIIDPIYGITIDVGS